MLFTLLHSCPVSKKENLGWLYAETPFTATAVLWIKAYAFISARHCLLLIPCLSKIQ